MMNVIKLKINPDKSVVRLFNDKAAQVLRSQPALEGVVHSPEGIGS